MVYIDSSMSVIKTTKDRIIKAFYGQDSVPRGLFELDKYFRIYGGIEFDHIKEDGVIVAKSNNFNQGSIITSGRSLEELDDNIEDAILTAFDVPSSYAKEVGLHPVGKTQKKYAIA